MTTPDPEPLAPQEPSPAPLEAEPGENPLVGWAKAIVYGIGDTAKDMLAEGRRGAREAMEQGWDRFDAKTKHRRK
ncbi:MAG TPA: hypothetical protein PKI89_05390 [Tepidiformaceae bacterium]|nr:hypothetical protein [Tepidiformaceae bacterium]HNO65793.1 hypothetical protein [Tepidiformaceae bacterium]